MRILFWVVSLLWAITTSNAQELEESSRIARQTSADKMVQNILQWLQGVYTQNSRKIRQGTLREYLPPSNTQKPRPFEPRPPYNGGGYPPSGIVPQPPFNLPGRGDYPSSPDNDITPPFSGFPTSQRPQTPFTGFPTTGSTPSPNFPTQTQRYPTQTPGYPTQTTRYPTQTTGYPTQTTGYPTQTTQRPGFPTQRPGFPTQFPPQRPGYGPYQTTQRPGYSYPTPSTGFTTQRPGSTYPTQSTGTQRPGYFPTQTTGFSTFPTQTPGSTYPTQRPGGFTTYPTQRPGFTTYPTQRPGFTTYPTQRPGFTTYPTQTTPGPSQTPGYTTQRPGFPTQRPGYQPSTPGFPQTTLTPITSGETETTPTPPGPASHFTSPVITTQPQFSESTTEDNNVVPGKTEPSENIGVTDNPPESTPSAEDLRHPPHIHAIDVECAKDMMTITIEFNRQFDGIIYSKGFYSNPECRYVNENSGQTKYRFTVNLNTCGTEFINAFDTQGQSYLENILVIQNELGIQEVWDTVRSVRCLWEGNIKDSLSVALSVGMLSQEIVTFSGDTAMAKLDIQLGKGPFAQPAAGLVKIGEPMTLVVSVSGDPGFDIQVKDCRATDSSGDRIYPLTDENGCILKPKLFGAFQKTRNTGNTGASIIAYAFFSAFKFPDVMDLTIQCNIELCKTDCQMCPEPNQQLEPGRKRRKRDLQYYNETLGDGVTMGRHLRVVLAEDLNANLVSVDGVCMSTGSFVVSTAITISLLVASTLISASLWLKNQRLHTKQ